MDLHALAIGEKTLLWRAVFGSWTGEHGQEIRDQSTHPRGQPQASMGLTDDKDGLQWHGGRFALETASNVTEKDAVHACRVALLRFGAVSCGNWRAEGLWRSFT